MRFARVAMALVGVACLTGLAGCGAVERALDQFDRAIDEVAALRQTLVLRSDALQNFLEKAQDKATRDVRGIIREDLRSTIDHSFWTAGKEFRCDVTYVNTVVLTYLEAIEKALKETRKKILIDHSLANLTPEAIVADVIANQARIRPHVCHVGLEKAAFVAKPAGSDPAFEPSGQERALGVIGFGMQRRSDERENYALYLIGADSSTRLVPAVAGLFWQFDAGELKLNLEEVARHLKAGDHTLELRYGDQTLTQVPVRLEPPPRRKRKLYARVHGIDVYNRGEGKNAWKLNLSLGFYGGTMFEWYRADVTDKGQTGEPGPDGVDRTFTRYPIDQTLGPVEFFDPAPLKVGVMLARGELSVASPLREKLESRLKTYQSLRFGFGGVSYQAGIDALERQLALELLPLEYLVFSDAENYGLDSHNHVFGDAKAHRLAIYDEVSGGGPAAYLYFSMVEVKE